MAAARPRPGLAASGPPEPETLDDARLKLQTAISAASIGTMAVEDLDAVEIAKEVRFGDPVVVLPAGWFPAGSHQKLSKRSFRFGAMATDRHPVGSSGYETARRSVLRALVALWVLPLHVGQGHGTKSPKPTTYVAWALALLHFARQVLAERDSDCAPGMFFGGLTEAQMLRAVEATRRAYSKTWPPLIASIDQLRTRGAVQDWIPAPRPANPDQAGGDRPALENARRGDAPPTGDPDEDVKFQPLPDVFVSEAGWRALWLIEQIGPGLTACFEDLASGGLLGGAQKHATLKERQVEAARRAVVVDQRWRTQDGSAITELPFPLRVGTAEHGREGLTNWPPASFAHVRQCATILQASHIFVVMLSMGARWSEVASLSRRCLLPDGVGDGPGRATGRTYKLVDRPGGAVRDWPLHPLAVAAIGQQIRLANALAPDIENLWVGRVGNTDAWGPLHSVDMILPRLAEAIGTGALLGGTSFHSHRFRKTVARLAALALVGAPKILMDLFGHRSIEMTLRYILSDPGLAAEVQEVAKGMVIMLGKEAIRTANDNGGPAAEILRDYMEARAGVSGSEALGTDDIHEAAEILTANGKAVAMVRPGILCTKLPGQAGPCTQKVGHPDPSRCRVECDHRLDLAAAKQDAVLVIERAIAALRTAGVAEDEMQWAFWQGQITAQLKRYKDLAGRFAAHSEVAALLGGTAEPAAA